MPPFNASRGIHIRGCGISVPDKVVTNDDLSKTLETSDEWIVERTGIRERRIGGKTSELAIEAGKRALKSAGLEPSDIDIVVLATTTPDGIVPATAPTIQAGLGIKGGAFDINAACSGFVYGLIVASGLIGAGSGRVLLIGADTLSSITDWTDRTMAVLVGDGAGAIVIEPNESGSDLLSWNMTADGNLRHLLKCDHGGFLYMDGKEIFRKAVRVVVDSAEKALSDAGLSPDDVDMLIPHQANLRIIQAACQRLGIPEDKTAVVIDRYGNTSSASIPLALDDVIAKGKIRSGSKLLLTGFGGGMTWASAVVSWNP